MGRVFFTDTCTIPAGPAGSLIPLAGIAYIPFVVDSSGMEGSQATAYADRMSLIEAPTLATGLDGSVGYWLDAGDYNIHVSDQQSPARISATVRGFTAPIIDTSQVVIAAQNLIQFTGDLKHSMQAVDHGLKSDGSYEWLLVSSDADGGGRKISHTLYNALWVLSGSPTPDSAGKFRLPNVSGRTLIASGSSTGLTSRHLNDVVGEETHVIAINEITNHSHGIAAGGTGITTVASATGATVNSGNAAVSDSGHSHSLVGFVIASTLGSWGFVSVSAGSGQVVPYNNNLAGNNAQLTADGTASAAISDSGHSHGLSDPTHSHTINDPTHSHGGATGAVGSTQPHNNIQPSYGMNCFIKS